MSSLNISGIKAIKRRAAKVDADPVVLEQFLKLAGARPFPRAKNGNSLAWRKNGVVACCSAPEENGCYINYELTVKTIWSGRDYTTVTKIEKSVLAPNSGLAFETIARAEKVTKWENRNG